jgi:putative transposase
MNRAYKFRIYPNLKQQKQFRLEFAASKTVWNYYLEKSINSYKETGKSLNRNDWCNDLKLLNKTEEYSWIMGACSQTYRSTLYDDLHAAYRNFFRRIKNGEISGFPKFKKSNYSVRYNNIASKYSPNNHKVWFSKNGWIKIIDYKPAFGKLMNITVSKSKDDKWWASICVEQKINEYENNSNSQIGIDMGVIDFLIDSNGNRIDNQNFYDKSMKKRAMFSRELSRKKIGSSNRKKARLKLAKFEAKIASQRKNFLDQNSTKLVKENNLIAHEDLNIKDMMKRNHNKDVKRKRILSRNISDVSWSEFFRMLHYKGEWYKCKIVKVDPKNTSRSCTNCGYIYTNLKNKREWVCPCCGTKHDRDINAANNILKLGIDVLEK